MPNAPFALILLMLVPASFCYAQEGGLSGEQEEALRKQLEQINQEIEKLTKEYNSLLDEANDPKSLDELLSILERLRDLIRRFEALAQIINIPGMDAEQIRAFQDALLEDIGSIIEPLKSFEKDLAKQIGKFITEIKKRFRTKPDTLDAGSAGTIHVDKAVPAVINHTVQTANGSISGLFFGIGVMFTLKVHPRSDCQRFGFVQCVSQTIRIGDIGTATKDLEIWNGPTRESESFTNRLDPIEVENPSSPLYPNQAAGLGPREFFFFDTPGVFDPWAVKEWQNKELELTQRFKCWIICLDGPAPRRVIGYIEYGHTVRIRVGTSMDDSGAAEPVKFDPEPRFVAANADNISGYNDCVQNFPNFRGRP